MKRRASQVADVEAAGSVDHSPVRYCASHIYAIEVDVDVRAILCDRHVMIVSCVAMVAVEKAIVPLLGCIGRVY